MPNRISPHEIKQVPAHDTLRSVVMWLRVVTFLWLAGLTVATLLTDDPANKTWVAATLVAAAAGTITTVTLARRGGLDSTTWVVVDGAIALFTVLAPALAGAADLFYGGYPLSWLILLVWAKPSLVWVAAGITALVAAQLASGALGIRVLSATDFIGDIAVWIVSGIVYGWGFYIVRVTDLRRQEAQEALARARVSTEIADDLHDSVLQTLAAIKMQPEGVDAKALAERLDREIRQEINRIRADHRDGFRVALYDTVCEVGIQMGVDLGRPMITGDAGPAEAMEVLIGATREAVVNAIKHSGTTAIHVSGEVGPETLTTVVHDTGAGIDPSHHAGAGIPSIRARIERVGGTATLQSARGQGTTWILTVPRR